MRSSFLKSLAFTVSVCLAFLIAACGEMDPDADPRPQVGSDPEGKILFISEGDVYLWAGGEPQQLTDFGDALSPAWAPDGERYLFVRTADAYSDLLIGNANTGNVQRLTNNEPGFTPGTPEYLSRVVWVLDPAWSRSSDSIAYVSDQQSEKNFVWYQSSPDASSTRIHCSATMGENVENPDFSPDGSQIVFAQRESGPADLQRWMEIRICELNSGELTELVEGEPGNGAYFPRWSPDGEWIAYIHRDDEGRNDLWVVSATGGDPVRLTEIGNITAPVWSPDGRQIAFFDREGSGFRAAYVDFEVDENGTPTASDPDELFNASGIDAPSGMSWSN